MTKQNQQQTHHLNIAGEYRQDWVNGIKEQDYKALLTKIETISPSNILDLCGGTGELTKRLQDKRYDVTLSDYDLKLLSVSKEKGIEKTIKLDVLNEEFPSGLDMIVMKSAEHEFQPNNLSIIHKKIYDALNEGGKYITWDVYPETKAQAEWVLEYVRTKDTIAGDMHLARNRYIYSEDECINKLEIMGFKNIQIVHRFYYNIQNSRLAQAYFSDMNGVVDLNKKEDLYKLTTDLINKYEDIFSMKSLIIHDKENRDYFIKIPALIVIGEK